LGQIRRVANGLILMDGGVGQYGLNPRYVPRGHGFLDPATTILYWLGLLIGILRWRDTGLWWCFLLVILLPVQILSTGTPDGARAIGAAPFMFTFVAFGLHKLLSLPIRRRIVLQVGGLLAVLAIAYYNISIYRWWMEQPETARARQPAVELEEFDRWQALQMQAAAGGQWGFTVDQWHGIRKQSQ
ncbi:MAG: hypothetical protein HW403_1042, partial [Dehalococcoidia bacterium]|nr:hypothetical protein [Dehalococcoidia bacterium]